MVVLQELVTPVTEALVTIACLLAVGAGVVLQPVNEQVLILLQNEKLKGEMYINTGSPRYTYVIPL